MNSPTASRSERRLARWILLGFVAMVTLIVAMGIGIASLFRLSRDAAILKREVMTATAGGWNAKIQLSAGWCTLTAARTAARLIRHEHGDDARLALAAVRQASVGVYERTSTASWDRRELVVHADECMASRGWSRVVGVSDDGEAVLVYARDQGDTDRMDVCVAVLDGTELVVVSTRVEAARLLELAEKHLPAGSLREKLKHTDI